MVAKDNLKQEGIGRAIGRIASGVYVVTTNASGKPDGMLTTWIQQTSFQPPMLIAGVQRQRHILEQFTNGTRFVVNILSKQNMNVYKNFARPYFKGLDRFAGLSLSNNLKSGPVLEEAVAYLECVVCGLLDSGDHCLVLGEITDGFVLHTDKEPMIHLRKNGFQY